MLCGMTERENHHGAIPHDLQACQTLVVRLAQRETELVQQVEAQEYLVAEHERTIAELQAKHQQTEQEKDEWKLAYQELLRRMFARRSERYLGDPNQLRLDFGPEAADAAASLAEAVEEAGIVIDKHVRRPQKKRRDEGLPEHLPRYEVVADVPAAEKQCPAHGARTLVGYDVTETLQFERPQLKVRVTKYPKYACEDAPQCGVAQAERPTGLVEGDKYDASVAAEIITNKYGYHLPVYRQQDLFAGSGWTPCRSTLLNVLEASAFVLEPLVEQIRQTVLSGDLLGTDDTTVTLIVPQAIPEPVPGDVKGQWAYDELQAAAAAEKPSVTARMWAYRSVTAPLVFFDFTVTRQRAGPELALKEFSGKLMADCYAGYQGIELRSDGRIQRGACVAHARRKVFEARDNYPREANLVLAKFRQLYDIEALGKTMSADERLALRQRAARPVWDSLAQWLASAEAEAVLPKSRFGQALAYLRNHWGPLQLYLTEGRMPIDNNDVEQLMKQVALGRKNWLFIGSVAAGDRAAGFLTLVASALRNDLDVWAYLDDVLRRLLAGETDCRALRPDAWAREHPQAIRTYRVQERRDKAERKRARTAQRLRAPTP
jgi:transposase